MKLKIIKYMFLVTLLGIGGHVIYLFKIYHSIVPHAYTIRGVILDYIRQNDKFPESQDALIKSGHLNLRTGQSKKEYYWFSSPWDEANNDITHLIFFDQFEIKYEISLLSLEIRDDNLYYKGTNNKVYLITGPSEKKLSHIYQQISIQWYEATLSLEVN